MFKKVTSLVLTILLLFAASTSAFAAGSTAFSDVDPGAWYADAVAYCQENSLMGGTGGSTFSPDVPMTRGMLVTVLYGSPAVSGTASFSDVAAGAWYAAPVAWAVQEDIAGGYGNGLFGTDDSVTREQCATILWRYAGSPTAEAGEAFADETAISDYAAQAVDWARANGIIGGMLGNLFSPKSSATRAQAAQILMGYDRMLRAPSTPAPEGTKILVAYFSATNNTEGVAHKLADGLGADLYEITPEQPYTSADLNYGSGSSRTSAERNDPDARPAISGSVEDMEQYDVVFLGYPIWWGEAPRIISTFIESYDFTGKTIVPFCTSGSSGYVRILIVFV